MLCGPLIAGRFVVVSPGGAGAGSGSDGRFMVTSLGGGGSGGVSGRAGRRTVTSDGVVATSMPGRRMVTSSVTASAGVGGAGITGAAGSGTDGRVTGKTDAHTLQRARTPAAGTLAGSTR